jgi:hypothetical protein
MKLLKDCASTLQGLYKVLKVQKILSSDGAPINTTFKNNN